MQRRARRSLSTVYGCYPSVTAGMPAICWPGCCPIRMATDRLTRRRHVMPVAGLLASGGSGSSGPGRERGPHRVGRRGGCGLPTIGLPPAAETAHRTLARSTRPAVARTRKTHLSRVAAVRGPRRPGLRPGAARGATARGRPHAPPGQPHRALEAEARPRSAPRGPARGRAGHLASASGSSIAAASGNPGTPFPSTRRTGRGHRWSVRAPAGAHAAALAMGQVSQDASGGVRDRAPA